MKYPITDEQIIPIIRLIKSSHGKDREELLSAAVEVLMYLVYSKARSYKSQPFYNDLLQEGRIGLIIAIDKFDETRGDKFFWFADWYLKLRFRSVLKTYVFTPRDVYKSFSSNNEEEEYYYDKDPIEIKQIRETIMNELEKLDDKSKQVLILKYGLNGGRPLTFREIGKINNVSRQRVEQIKVAALGKLEKKQIIKELYFGGM